MNGKKRIWFIAVVGAVETTDLMDGVDTTKRHISPDSHTESFEHKRACERRLTHAQRNFGSIADSCHKTKEPVYLTKNGSASLVVMDAEAYDEQTRALTAIQEREDRIQRSIAHGHEDLTNGRVRPWKQAKAEADRMLASR